MGLRSQVPCQSAAGSRHKLILQSDNPQLVTAGEQGLESLLLWGLLVWEGHGRSRAATLHAPFFCNFISSACAWACATVGVPALSFLIPFLFKTAGACSLSDLKVPAGEEHTPAPQPGGPLWPARDDLRLLEGWQGHVSFSGVYLRELEVGGSPWSPCSPSQRLARVPWALQIFPQLQGS